MIRDQPTTHTQVIVPPITHDSGASNAQSFDSQIPHAAIQPDSPFHIIETYRIPDLFSLYDGDKVNEMRWILANRYQFWIIHLCKLKSETECEFSIKLLVEHAAKVRNEGTSHPRCRIASSPVRRQFATKLLATVELGWPATQGRYLDESMQH